MFYCVPHLSIMNSNSVVCETKDKVSIHLDLGKIFFKKIIISI